MNSAGVNIKDIDNRFLDAFSNKNLREAYIDSFENGIVTLRDKSGESGDDDEVIKADVESVRASLVEML